MSSLHAPIRKVASWLAAVDLRARWLQDIDRTRQKFKEWFANESKARRKLEARVEAALQLRPVGDELRTEWRRDVKAGRVKGEEQLQKLRREYQADQGVFGQRLELTRDRAAALDNTVKEVTKQLAAMQHELKLLRSTLTINMEHREQRHSSDALSPALVVPHIRRAIASGSVGTAPMPHLTIESLLPQETYRALLDGLPPSFFFTHGAPTKPDLKLSPSSVAPEWTHRCIRFLEEVVVEEMVKPLLARLEEHLARGYAQTLGEEAGALLARAPHEATGGRLMVRRPGYHIDPHLDPQRSIISCLIYLARPGDDERFGTQLFRIDSTPRIDRTNTYYPLQHGHECTLVHTVPFKPNSAVAFINAGGAHGADIPKDAPAATERYSYQFYVSAERTAAAAVCDRTPGLANVTVSAGH